MNGLGVFWTYAALLGEFYLGMTMLTAAMIAVGALAVGARALNLLRVIHNPR